MKNNQKIQITCQKCGKFTFVGNHTGKYCKKCKHEVILEYRRNLKHKKRQSLMLTCKICGKDLTDIKSSRKYCPDCRGGVVAKYNKDHYFSEYREKNLSYNREYYKKPENKERHRESALKSYHRRKKINKRKLAVSKI